MKFCQLGTVVDRYEVGRNGPPPVTFMVVEPDSRHMMASPPGAVVLCTLVAEDRSRILLLDVRACGPAAPGEEQRSAPRLIAELEVIVPSGASKTQETVDLASAVYWSWWRAEALRGQAP